MLLISCAEPTYLLASDSNNKTQTMCAQNTCLSVDWTEGPHFRKDSVLILTVRSEQSELMDLPDGSHFYLYMPDHGHPGDPLQVTRLEKGLYKIEKILFFMKGQWDLHISQTQDEDGSKNDLILPLIRY